MNLAVFLAIPLAAAALVLARIGSALLQSGMHAVSAVSGVDIDFDFGDDIAQAVQGGAEDSIESSPKKVFDMSASVITIQGDDTHDADADAENVDDETGFKAEPIEASPLHGYYDNMTCEALQNAVRELEARKVRLVSTNFGGTNDNRIEKIEGALEVAETVRLGKLLDGDALCNF